MNLEKQENEHVALLPVETDTPDQFTGSWCNRQHGGLLIRKVCSSIPSGATRPGCVAQR